MVKMIVIFVTASIDLVGLSEKMSKNLEFFFLGRKYGQFGQNFRTCVGVLIVSTISHQAEILFLGKTDP